MKRKDILEALTQRGVPDYLHDGFVLYITDGVSPGGFVRAVLENNLASAFLSASPKTKPFIENVVSFVYHDMPMMAWGSEDKVLAWIKSHAQIRQPSSDVHVSGLALDGSPQTETITAPNDGTAVTGKKVFR